MSDEKTIAPCPFCGAGADISEIEQVYFIGCKRCAAGSCGSVDLSKAIAAWNRRTSHWEPMPMTPTRIEALTVVLDYMEAGKQFYSSAAQGDALLELRELVAELGAKAPRGFPDNGGEHA